ncbi:MAG: phosphoserine phosphatase SerB [Paracoccaceae bacterium]|jgi:phosphoserine phosphatase|nr:phosphoserine phosphatase SerB [Paracoccaceae bacterium]
MPVVVLITNPARPTLDPAAVRALRDAWGGGAATWLAPDLAVEFTVPQIPDTLGQAWTDMQPLGVDLCVVPEAGRRKRLLIADMDSTMIGQECIDELAEMAGVGDRVKEVTARAMNGEIGFEGALRERVALLDGLETPVIDRVLQERITEAPGGQTLVATMRAHGAHTLLVSGGFTSFSGPVAARLGFDDHQANVLLEADGRLTGGVAEPILGREAKVAALEAGAARLGIDAADVIALGDGANDLGMLARAGMGVAMHAKPSVAAQCDLRINHGDLTAALFLQGYPADAFA